MGGNGMQKSAAAIDQRPELFLTGRALQNRPKPAVTGCSTQPLRSISASSFFPARPRRRIILGGFLGHEE